MPSLLLALALVLGPVGVAFAQVDISAVNGLPAKLQALQDAINRIQLTPGPPGPRGADGAPGPQGPAGPAYLWLADRNGALMGPVIATDAAGRPYFILDGRVLVAYSASAIGDGTPVAESVFYYDAQCILPSGLPVVTLPGFTAPLAIARHYVDSLGRVFEIGATSSVLAQSWNDGSGCVNHGSVSTPLGPATIPGMVTARALTQTTTLVPPGPYSLRVVAP